MKGIAVFGGISLFFLVFASSHATSEQCNRVFQALVDMRGNLTDFFEGDQTESDKVKKTIFYWTNVNVDDDEKLRQGVCQIVSASSIDEMAAAARIPRNNFPQLYRSLKYNGEWYKTVAQEQANLNPTNVLPQYRQAFRTYIRLWNVVKEARLDRFQVPPEPIQRGMFSGCREMVSKGLQVYPDRGLLFPDDPSKYDRLKSITGIDINDKEQVTIVLCKLGEVSDLSELSAVINMPIAVVREGYPDAVAGLRLIDMVIRSGHVFPGIPERVPQNFLRFLETVAEAGLLNLAD